MIETETTWEDSGFDCDHCGGVILKRTDRETGLPDKILYQCRDCSCQWNLDGRLQRIGTGPGCKSAAHPPQASFDMTDVASWFALLSRNLWILLAIISGAILLRFGGAVAVRFLLPVFLLGAGVYTLLRYGQKHSWW